MHRSECSYSQIEIPSLCLFVVVYSSEFTFERFGSNYHQYAWKRSGESYSSGWVQPSVKQWRLCHHLSISAIVIWNLDKRGLEL